MHMHSVDDLGGPGLSARTATCGQTCIKRPQHEAVLFALLEDDVLRGQETESKNNCSRADIQKKSV